MREEERKVEFWRNRKKETRCFPQQLTTQPCPVFQGKSYVGVLCFCLWTRVKFLP